MVDIEKYIDQLEDVLSKTQVTDINGGTLSARDGLEKLLSIIYSQSENGNKVILIGNGGSASIANHIAVDLWKNGGVKAISFSDSSLLTCISNDFGYEHVFEKPVEMFASENDILIAISSSGRSKNILNGVEAAKQKKCHIVTMSGFDADNPLRASGAINFYVPSGSYGFVEIAHLTLCHYISDVLTSKREIG